MHSRLSELKWLEAFAGLVLYMPSFYAASVDKLRLLRTAAAWYMTFVDYQGDLGGMSTGGA